MPNIAFRERSIFHAIVYCYFFLFFIIYFFKNSIFVSYRCRRYIVIN